MKTNIGLWIDHQKAVIVSLSPEEEDFKIILSYADRQPGRTDVMRRAAPFEAKPVAADDVHQRKYTADLARYYEEVISHQHVR